MVGMKYDGDRDGDPNDDKKTRVVPADVTRFVTVAGRDVSGDIRAPVEIRRV